MDAPDVRGALRWAESELLGRAETPSVDAEALLRHVLGESRTQLFAHATRIVAGAPLEHYRQLVSRRRAGEPLQYLTGVAAFRRLELLVGPGVLVPRPETEVLVEHALACIEEIDHPVVVDAGTGSGAIALSIAVEHPGAAVFGTDSSTEALEWARRNLERVGSPNLELALGDLFDPLPRSLRTAVDLVVANPPYLSEDEHRWAPVDVRDHEPIQATMSGLTGLEVTDRIIEEAGVWLRPGGYLVLEVTPERAEAVGRLMERRYQEVSFYPDLTGRTRVAAGRLPPNGFRAASRGRTGGVRSRV